MSDVSQTAALAAILDALTLMQDQVEEIGVLIPREAAPSFRNDAAPLFRELLAP